MILKFLSIIYHFIDYISYDVAKLGVQIQGQDHLDGEWSDITILKVFCFDKKKDSWICG
jgi:hypothetical protein